MNEVHSRIEDGEAFKLRQTCLFRKTEYGNIKFCGGPIYHKHDFDIVFELGLRHKKVDEMVFMDRGRSAKDNWTCTVGAELGNLRDRTQQRWTIQADTSLPLVATEVAELYKQVGMPFISTYESLEMVFETLIGDDKLAWLISPIHQHRARIAVVAALLLLGPDAASNTATTKCRQLHERNDKQLDEFHKFLQLAKNTNLHSRRRFKTVAVTSPDSTPAHNALTLTPRMRLELEMRLFCTLRGGVVDWPHYCVASSEVNICRRLNTI